MLMTMNELDQAKQRIADLEAALATYEQMPLRDVEGALVKRAMVRFKGNVSRAAKALGLTGPLAKEAEDLTKRNTVMTLNMAFNYGGRAEIVDAVRQLVHDGVRAEKIDERAIRSRLYHPEIPDPDVVIRTSGEYRISNYLLWEMAYSELVFTDVLWPDFRREHLYAAVEEYQQRNRRYGGLEQ